MCTCDARLFNALTITHRAITDSPSQPAEKKRKLKYDRIVWSVLANAVSGIPRRLRLRVVVRRLPAAVRRPRHRAYPHAVLKSYRYNGTKTGQLTGVLALSPWPRRAAQQQRPQLLPRLPLRLVRLWPPLLSLWPLLLQPSPLALATKIQNATPFLRVIQSGEHS